MSLNPIDHETLYDAIVLGGVRSPGFVTLSGHARSEKWDIKDGDGQDGASTTRKGKKVAQFSASFRLVKDPVLGVDEYAEWDSFLPTLKSTTASKAPVALDIYHPDLAELGIGSVVIEEIGGKVHDGKGGATVSVKFLEYSPPKPKSGSPKGSKGNSEPFGPPKPDPNADAKAELDAVLAEASGP